MYPDVNFPLIKVLTCRVRNKSEESTEKKFPHTNDKGETRSEQQGAALKYEDNLKIMISRAGGAGGV